MTDFRSSLARHDMFLHHCGARPEVVCSPLVRPAGPMGQRNLRLL